MPSPTSSWGQSNWSDVYAPVGSTPTVPVGSGLQAGQCETLFDGSVVQFLDFVASTVAGAACIPATPFTGYTVTPATAALQIVTAINDRAGGGLGTSNVTIAANSYAWGTIAGFCYPLCVNALAAGKYAVASAISAQLKLQVVGTDPQSNILNLVVVGSSPAQSLCQITY
jgi:hypothetical protein